ncbi:MAG: hypothetical protein ACYDEF_07580 [Methanosarcina sp.]
MMYFSPVLQIETNRALLENDQKKYYIDKLIQKYKLLREEITESWEQK